MKYDYLIVGSGLFGSVFAQQAKERGKKILVIDQRKHVGGNCYTRNIEGINVHEYGPHIFHTSNEKVWNYVNRFTKFNHFSYRPRVNFNGKIYSFPINMMTFYQLWGVTTPAEAEARLATARRPLENSQTLEGWVLSQVGEEIYETFVKGYTKKQWMKDPKDLPSSIIRRIPFRMTYDDRYYEDTYEGIPIGGYTQIFEKMLDGCEVQLGVNFFDEREMLIKLAKKIVYTGKIDEYYDYMFGELNYRSLNFEHKTLTGDFQGVAGMNYTSEVVPYTRTIEHKHFEFTNSDKTVVTWETPAVWTKDKVPYYPMIDAENTKRHQQYKTLAEVEPNVIFGGRLATFRYMDMHAVIAEALHKSEKELNG